MYEASSTASLRRSCFQNSHRDVFGLTDNDSNSRLYEKFMQGLLERMGRDVRSNKALNYKVLHVILDNLMRQILDPKVSYNRRRWCVMLGCYLIISFGFSLRGNEGFMVEAGGLINHINDGNAMDESHPHVLIPLLVLPTFMDYKCNLRPVSRGLLHNPLVIYSNPLDY